MAERISFGKLKDVLAIPDLIDIQTESLGSFLQAETPESQRLDQGLQEVFNEVFPIESIDKEVKLNFDSYSLGEAKLKVVDCLKDGHTFSGPLHAEFTLETKDEKIKEKFSLETCLS